MAFELKGITKGFDGHEVLAGIDLDFEAGSIAVLLGPSGCGKTTLLNLIAGLSAPDSGERRGFEGIRFSYAFQEPRLLPWLTARENAAFALSGVMERGPALARVDALLEAAGLAEASGRRPEALSGGMKQRLSLVRAFAFPAEVLLLDEAFTAVDLKTKIELMDVFLSLWRADKPTVISVTHDVEEAVYLADRALVLSPRPARVIDDFRIEVPREERSLGSESTMEAEARLYRLILGERY
jgi:NitT/TauT family transport system ATP-binding protein